MIHGIRGGCPEGCAELFLKNSGAMTVVMAFGKVRRGLLQGVWSIGGFCGGRPLIRPGRREVGKVGVLVKSRRVGKGCSATETTMGGA